MLAKFWPIGHEVPTHSTVSNSVRVHVSSVSVPPAGGAVSFSVISTSTCAAGVSTASVPSSVPSDLMFGQWP